MCCVDATSNRPHCTATHTSNHRPLQSILHHHTRKYSIVRTTHTPLKTEYSITSIVANVSITHTQHTPIHYVYRDGWNYCKLLESGQSRLQKSGTYRFTVSQKPRAQHSLLIGKWISCCANKGPAAAACSDDTRDHVTCSCLRSQSLCVVFSRVGMHAGIMAKQG